MYFTHIDTYTHTPLYPKTYCFFSPFFYCLISSNNYIIRGLYKPIGWRKVFVWCLYFLNAPFSFSDIILSFCKQSQNWSDKRNPLAWINHGLIFTFLKKDFALCTALLYNIVYPPFFSFFFLFFQRKLIHHSLTLQRQSFFSFILFFFPTFFCVCAAHRLRETIVEWSYNNCNDNKT